MTQVLLTQREGDVVVLTMNRADSMNALSPELLTALAAGISGAEEAGARALVLTGAGASFCSGADLKQRGRMSADAGENIDLYYNPVARAIADLRIPLIVAMNGPAVGAGAGFAIGGDIVIAERSAYLLFAFVNIGLVPDAGTTWHLTRSVGKARAMDMLLSGEKIDAAAAHDAGLVSRVVDDGTALNEAKALASRLAQGPSKSIGLIRAQVLHALDHGFEASLDMERAHQSTAGFTQDFAEAIAAFREKRKPEFKGR
ncbi:enoyl-CoA hydratase-related protein [Croceicoccus hydrothermalis]|uniref:enoyl-CoA hydratase-related protein n=1 Tax=Croceicoccus hydrothermalis TaxID=2867964 RepID=UPI001EFA949E|nr:enoyl-CoA hydratase-related protein [Croceicoccus hydrothermalis]